METELALVSDQSVFKGDQRRTCDGHFSRLLDTAWGMINGLFLNKNRQMNKSQKVSRSLTFLRGGLIAIVCWTAARVAKRTWSPLVGNTIKIGYSKQVWPARCRLCSFRKTHGQILDYLKAYWLWKIYSAAPVIGPHLVPQLHFTIWMKCGTCCPVSRQRCDPHLCQAPIDF